jgi:hypothetical protein
LEGSARRITQVIVGNLRVEARVVCAAARIRAEIEQRRGSGTANPRGAGIQTGEGKMSFAPGKWFWLVCVVVLIAGAVVFWMIQAAQPLRLVVLLDDVGDLKRGDPVVWKTFTIGKVESIEPLVDNHVGVAISIKEDYAPGISHGTTFMLRSSQLMGLIGQSAIEVQTPRPPGTPFARGEKVHGVRAGESSLLEEGKQWTLEKWHLLKDQVSQMLEESRSSAYRAELEDALAKARVLAEDGAREIRQGAEDLRKEHAQEFEEALRKLEQVRDEMYRKGDKEAAKLLDVQIAKLREMLKS